MKKLVIPGIVLVIAILSAAAFFVIRPYLSNLPKGTPTEIEAARIDTIVTKVSAKGEVTLLNKEKVYSNTEAEVSEVLVKKNDTITKGQPLLRYNPKRLDELRDQLKEAGLNLRTAEISLASSMLPVSDIELQTAKFDVTASEKSVKEAEIALSEHDKAVKNKKDDLSYADDSLQKSKNLFGSGAITKNELDNSQRDVDNLKYQLSVLESERVSKEAEISRQKDLLVLNQSKLNNLVDKLNDDKVKNEIASNQIVVEQYKLKVSQIQRDIDEFQHELLSPVEGTIIDLNVSEGEVTPTEKWLFEVADLDDYVVTINIKERSAPKIKLGQEVSIESPVFGKEVHKGSVTKISPIAEEKATSNGSEKIVPVEIEMDKNAPPLKPGYSMEATIVTDIAENVVTVPIMSTLSEKDGRSYVFVVKEDNSLEKRYVTMGAFSDLNVEVTGISDGEKIVSQPSGMTIEGSVIIPVEPVPSEEGELND